MGAPIVIAANEIRSTTLPDVKLTYTLYKTDIVSDPDSKFVSSAIRQVAEDKFIGPQVRTVYSISHSSHFSKGANGGALVKPWNGEELKYQIGAYSGIGFGYGTYTDTMKPIEDSGKFSRTSYSNWNIIKDIPWFMVGLNRNKSDVSGAMWLYEHARGNFIWMQGPKAISGYSQVPNNFAMATDLDGNIYITVQETSYFGYVSNDTSVWSQITMLEPRIWYILRATPNIVKGIVYDAAGVPAQDCIVRMYNRASGQLVGDGISGPDGSYELFCVAGQGQEVYGVCLDSGKGQQFEAIALDRIKVE